MTSGNVIASRPSNGGNKVAKISHPSRSDSHNMLTSEILILRPMTNITTNIVYGTYTNIGGLITGWLGGLLIERRTSVSIRGQVAAV